MTETDINPAAALLRELIGRHLTVATAESCTGGNIAHLITAIPGSSEAMLGGIVSYANSAKEHLLDVSRETLEAYGAVSIPVVEQMARGACRAFGADIAMATSGMAGPGGGSPDKPTGTVCIAVCKGERVVSHTFHFHGNRGEVIDLASREALSLALSCLQ